MQIAIVFAGRPLFKGGYYTILRQLSECLNVPIVTTKVNTKVVIWPTHAGYDYDTKEEVEHVSEVSKHSIVVAYAITEGPYDEEVKSFLESVADVIVTSSEFMAKNIGLSVDTIIPHWIDDVFFKKHTKYENKIFDVAYFANLSDLFAVRKGPDIAIKVLQRFTHITSKSVADKLQNSSYVQDASTEELASVVAISKFLLFPSRSEGFGIPPLEAMATGTVPICSDAPAHNEHCLVKVPTKYYGVVTPVASKPHVKIHWYESCWRDYVEVIEDLLHDRERYNKLVAEGLKIAQRFRKELICPQWHEFLKRLI